MTRLLVRFSLVCVVASLTLTSTGLAYTRPGLRPADPKWRRASS